MTTTELKNAIATRIAELKSDNHRMWEYDYDVIDYTDAAMYGEDDEVKESAYVKWAEETGYWDKLQKYAYDDIDVCDPDNIDAYLGGINDNYGLTVDFEQEYKNSCLQRIRGEVIDAVNKFYDDCYTYYDLAAVEEGFYDHDPNVGNYLALICYNTQVDQYIDDNVAALSDGFINFYENCPLEFFDDERYVNLYNSDHLLETLAYDMDKFHVDYPYEEPSSLEKFSEMLFEIMNDDSKRYWLVRELCGQVVDDKNISAVENYFSANTDEVADTITSVLDDCEADFDWLCEKKRDLYEVSDFIGRAVRDNDVLEDIIGDINVDEWCDEEYLDDDDED